MRITSVLLTAALIVAWGTDTQTQRRRASSQKPATLTIFVTDPSGTPVNGVLVELQGAAMRSGRTEQGRITLENVPAGVYRLRFEREGFTTLERDINAQGGAPAQVNVTLTPAPPAKPQPAGPPKPAGPPAQALSLDISQFIEKNYIGREPSKTSQISCAPGGSASLIQVRDPVEEHAHGDADEFIYVVAGEGAVRIGEDIHLLESGGFAVVPRTQPHVLTARGRNPLMVLSIKAGERCAE